jgi:hypothetical protein
MKLFAVQVPVLYFFICFSLGIRTCTVFDWLLDLVSEGLNGLNAGSGSKSVRIHNPEFYFTILDDILFTYMFIQNYRMFYP